MKRTLLATAAMALAASATLPAYAFEAGDILVRGRVIGVIPTDNADSITGVSTTTGLDADAAVMPELDFTYFITDSIGVELIAAATPHDIEATGTLANLGEVASAWLLPPTLSLRYHHDTGTKFTPYVGAGINVTIPFALDASASLENALGGPTEVGADVSVGWSVGAGVDYQLTDRLYLNFDAKYVSLDTDVRLEFATGTGSADLDINPVILGFGIGYRF